LIITSLLDNDLYKFLMMQLVYEFHKNDVAKYKFFYRGESKDFSNIHQYLIKQFNELNRLSFTEDELNYLSNLKLLNGSKIFTVKFISFLRLFRFDTNQDIKFDVINGKINLEIEGPWIYTILYEVPLMSIISECFNYVGLTNIELHDFNLRLENKCEGIEIHKLRLCEMGTRRRHSRGIQDLVVKRLSKLPDYNFYGTSNVYLAKNNGVRPIGSMAHEWFMAHQAFTNPDLSTEVALKKWNSFYGCNHVALSDTLGLSHFLDVFDRKLADSFIGVRHDSGNPIEFGRQVINKYRKLGIEPESKFILFSDGLDICKAIELNQIFKDEINVLFGIGTNLTNDFDGCQLNIVIKMIEMNGYPVNKLSDSPGKETGEDEDLLNFMKNRYLSNVLMN